MTIADPWIDAIRLAHDDIADRARTFDAGALAGPSGCSEWNVAQVLGHLGSQSEIGQGAIDAALEHRDPPGPDANPPIWDRWNAMDDAAKAAGFLDRSERVTATYEGIDPATRESLRIDLGFLPEPVDLSVLLFLRLNELTLHGWDVRVGTDPDAVLLESSTGLLLDRAGMLIGFFGHGEAIDGSVALRVETSDPDRVLGLSIGDQVAIGDPPDQPDGVLQIPAEAFLRLMAGRLAPDRTPPSVKLASDAITLDDLRRVFPGM